MRDAHGWAGVNTSRFRENCRTRWAMSRMCGGDMAMYLRRRKDSAIRIRAIGSRADGKWKSRRSIPAMTK